MGLPAPDPGRTVLGRRALRLFFVVAILALLSVASELADHSFGYGGFLHLDELFAADVEGNVTTWFASLVLLSIGALALITGLASRRTGGGWHRHWFALAALLALMSLDETAHLHEKVGTELQAWLDTGGPLRFAWILIGIPVAVAVAASSRRFVRALPELTRRRLTIAAGVFVAGALGMEVIGAIWIDANDDGLVFGLLATIEETLEMSGAVLALAALADHASLAFASVRIRLDRDGLGVEVEGREEIRPRSDRFAHGAAEAAAEPTSSTFRAAPSAPAPTAPG